MSSLQFPSAGLDHFTGPKVQGKISIHLPVHIRTQQRRGKKCLTIVEGLAEDLDLRKISRALKQSLSTSCAIVEDERLGSVLQLAGDHRRKIKAFLLETHICEGDRQIVVHGY